MEAGLTSCNEFGMARVVTANDYNELWRQYKYREGFEKRHEIAIKVLRERQSREFHRLVKKNADKVGRMQDLHASELTQLDKGFVVALQETESLFATRKERLERRWAVDVADWKKRHADAGDIPRPFTLPSIEWN